MSAGRMGTPIALLGCFVSYRVLDCDLGAIGQYLRTLRGDVLIRPSCMCSGVGRSLLCAGLARYRRSGQADTKAQSTKQTICTASAACVEAIHRASTTITVSAFSAPVNGWHDHFHPCEMIETLYNASDTPHAFGLCFDLQRFYLPSLMAKRLLSSRSPLELTLGESLSGLLSLAGCQCLVRILHVMPDPPKRAAATWHYSCPARVKRTTTS